MPFKLGKDPIRFSLQYLQKGTLVLKPRVRILLLHCNAKCPSHNGLRQFVHWFLPQIQYKNPEVQIVSMYDQLPTPMIRAFLDNDEDVLVDTEWKTKEEILAHLTRIFGVPEKVQQMQRDSCEAVRNRFHFGDGHKRYCICELPGQVPCPYIVPLPKEWRGKYINSLDNE